MTPIVQNVTRLIAGFIAVFGVYLALTGHTGPGGGFPGGVVLAAAGVLTVLAFGRGFSGQLFSLRACRVAGAAGALGFVIVAVCGYFMETGFFTNFVPRGEPELISGGSIVLSDLAILVNVSAGLFGAFLVLSAFRPAGGPAWPRPSAEQELNWEI
ncbi:MAG: MnhB domain-containing protein [Planctomycetota bacterium]|jgi:multicomponent Na+:H+ antiporter subunit B